MKYKQLGLRVLSTAALMSIVSSIAASAFAATHHLSQRLEQAEAENSQLYAMKRDFGRVWNYFGAEKMQQVIGLMREQEQTADKNQKKSRQNSVEL